MYTDFTFYVLFSHNPCHLRTVFAGGDVQCLICCAIFNHIMIMSFRCWISSWLEIKTSYQNTKIVLMKTRFNSFFLHQYEEDHVLGYFYLGYKWVDT